MPCCSLRRPALRILSGNLGPALFQFGKAGLSGLLLDPLGSGGSDLRFSQNRLHSGKHLLSGFADQLLRLSQHLADQPFLRWGIAALRGQTPILVIGDDLFVLQLRLGADGIGYKLHGLVVGDFRNLVNQGLGILQPERHGFQLSRFFFNRRLLLCNQFLLLLDDIVVLLQIAASTVAGVGFFLDSQTMPFADVKQTYKAVEKPWNNPFSDVSEGDWYYEAVRFVHERDLMNGYSDGRFGPNDPLSRAQLAQILFNKEGKPVVNYLLDFSDVANEAWYTEAIRWAVESGILNGYGDGRLGPQGQATRAQVAQMLKNFIENQEENT